MTTHTEKFWDLIDDVKTCMMVTRDDAGRMTARPMHAIVEREVRQIWFYTEIASEKAMEVMRDGQVCLTFGCPRTNDFVSVTGTAAISQDRDMIRRHWSTFVDAWFPGGPEAANVAMIRVEVEAGEYWDSQSSKVVAAIKMMIASQTDSRPDLGENAKVKFG